MGNLYLEQPKEGESAADSKQTQIDIEAYRLVGRDDRGYAIVEMSSGALAVLLVMDMDSNAETHQQGQLMAWFNAKFSHLSNVLAYEVKKEVFLCNKMVQMKVLIEYFPANISKILTEAECSVLEAGSALGSLPLESNLELINFAKFLLETAQ